MKNRSLLDSFNNALNGIIATLKNERNFKIHFTMAFVALIAALFLDLNSVEFLILLSAITLVIVMELINTAIEAVVDLVCGDNYREKARLAKDAAAGGVFIAAMYSVAVGYIVIVRKVIEKDYITTVKERIGQTPIYIVLVCTLVVLMLTIIIKAYSGRESLLKGGMPSAHSAVSFCAATCILILTSDVTVITLGYFLALLVAQSRVEGRIHSYIQVILGSCLGFFTTILIFKFIGYGGWF